MCGLVLRTSVAVMMMPVSCRHGWTFPQAWIIFRYELVKGTGVIICHRAPNNAVLFLGNPLKLPYGTLALFDSAQMGNLMIIGVSSQ